MPGVNSVYPVKYFVYFYSELFHCAGASEVKTLVQAIICQSAPNLHTLYPPYFFIAHHYPAVLRCKAALYGGGLTLGTNRVGP